MPTKKEILKRLNELDRIQEERIKEVVDIEKEKLRKHPLYQAAREYWESKEGKKSIKKSLKDGKN